ncbi:MAG: RNA polymerase sigma factor [Bacteroidetes bacterium]|nr:RNA polymerase sigma factor [Bacteroidota bacterium]
MTAGSERALEQLYSRYFAKLCGYAMHAFGVADPRDIVQDVFLKIIRNPKSFRAEYRFNTWIYTLVSNQCKNEYKTKINRARLQEQILFETQTFQQHTGLDAAGIQRQLNIAWRELSEKEKSIYLLKYEHQFSTKEISEILNIPEGSVKSGLFHTLRKISQYLHAFTH